MSVNSEAEALEMTGTDYTVLDVGVWGFQASRVVAEGQGEGKRVGGRSGAVCTHCGRIHPGPPRCPP